MVTIYYVVVDCGDGSSTVEWWREHSKKLQYKLDEAWEYQGNEGSPNELHLPDGTDLNTLGIHYWGDDE